MIDLEDKDVSKNFFTMKKAIIALILLSVVYFAKAARVDTVWVESLSMQKKVEVVVIVPDVALVDSCPVVYLLHGHGGNAHTWLSIKPELPQISDAEGSIFVCPDGENSWYWDSPLHPEMKYETFVSKELIAYVDTHYHTVANRRGRAISGLSMGGHGAMWNAIRHPDVFSIAGSMSGGLDIRPFPKNWDMSDQLGTLETHPEHWENHTVINLVPSMKPAVLALIFDCGESDFFHEVNVAYHRALLKQGIEHDFITRPGNHDSAYWANAIDYQILFF